MKETISEALKHLNQNQKNGLFLNFVLSKVYDSIQINSETFQAKPIEILEALIESGVDVNTRAVLQQTSLFFVKSKEIVELLIQHGADVNARNRFGNTLLFEVKSKEIAEVLIQAGADVKTKNNDGNTPLHWNNNPEIIELLIQHGADMSARGHNGQTPAEYHRSYNLHPLTDFIEQKAIEFEQEKLNQVLPLPQSQKSSNHPPYRL